VILVTEFGLIRSRRDRHFVKALESPCPNALLWTKSWNNDDQKDLKEGEKQLAQERLPKPVQDFRKRYPEVWKAFNELGDRCHAAGPLDEKTRRLVKVALSMGAGLEGATHSAIRNARRAGITLDEINHVAVLAVSTLGLPAAIRAFTWASDRSRGIKS
jgi:4-carboxymuconolactone decarboxylase